MRRAQTLARSSPQIHYRDELDWTNLRDCRSCHLLEINRAEEILAYLRVLRGDGPDGEPVAANPVLVKGKRVWYEDPDDPINILFFEHEDGGIPIEWYPYVWGKDHNVRPREEAWVYTWQPWPTEGCRDCHRQDTLDSPVFDRKILVDSYGLDGQPEYETVTAMTDCDPP